MLICLQKLIVHIHLKTLFYPITVELCGDNKKKDNGRTTINQLAESAGEMEDKHFTFTFAQEKYAVGIRKIKEVIGIVVDAVSEVLNIGATDIVDTPTFGARLNTDYILRNGENGRRSRKPF